MLSHLSKEITGQAASWSHEKYRVRLDFCTIPLSAKSASTVYISSVDLGCLNAWKKYCSWYFLELLCLAIGRIHNFLYTLIKTLFKYIYNACHTFSPVLRCT